MKHEINCNYDQCGCRINPFVWVSDNLRAIYFEVPKVASSSIKHYLNFPKLNYSYILLAAHQLAKRYQAQIELASNFNAAQRYIFSKNLKKLNSKQDAINESDCNILQQENNFYPYFGDLALKSHYFKFTFVRSPHDRFISNWAMFNQKPERKAILEKQLGHKFNSLGIDEFIEITSQVKNHHWQNQRDFIPFGAPSQLDFIGSMETMSVGLRELANKFNLKIDSDKVTNKTNHKRFQEILSTDQIRQIGKTYAEDLELYQTVSQFAPRI